MDAGNKPEDFMLGHSHFICEPVPHYMLSKVHLLCYSYKILALCDML